MAKIALDKVAEAIKAEQVEPDKLRRIIERLNLEAQPEPGSAEDAPPACKKQFAVLVSDPENRLSGVPDLVAWVLRIPENESVATVQDRIFRAAYDFNASKKGRLLPVKTVGEALENVATKYFKEADVWVNTKTPVLMLRTNNEIPRDTSGRYAEPRNEEEGEE